MGSLAFALYNFPLLIMLIFWVKYPPGPNQTLRVIFKIRFRVRVKVRDRIRNDFLGKILIPHDGPIKLFLVPASAIVSVCGMVPIKDPLPLIEKSSPCCNSSSFTLSLTEWAFTMSDTV